MKGMSEKIQVNLWDGFHKVLVNFVKAMLKVKSGEEEMTEEKDRTARLIQKAAPVLPLFITNVNGKFDFDIKPEDLEAVMGLP